MKPLGDTRQRWAAPATEWDARVELAAAYRAAAIFGWTDLSSTHFSVRVPGEDDAFLMLQRNYMFDEVTASSLVKIGIDGELRSDRVPTEAINQAGVTIHGALHAGCPAVRAVLHTHTTAGVAVSCHPDGLLPLNQHAMRFYSRQGRHRFEGFATDADEGPRLVDDLGDNELLILENHGLLTVGESIPAAFSALYYAERACEMQVDILASGEVIRPPEEVCESTAKQYAASTGFQYADWQGIVRMVDRNDPSYCS